MIVNGLHVLGFLALVFGVPLAMAFVGDWAQARRSSAGPLVQPMDYELHHYGALPDFLNMPVGQRWPVNPDLGDPK